MVHSEDELYHGIKVYNIITNKVCDMLSQYSYVWLLTAVCDYYPSFCDDSFLY